MNTADLIGAEKKYIVQTYVRPDIVLARGDGVYLFDQNGQRYLDMMAGIAVTALGHSDEQWAAAVAQQATQLTHVSNLFHTEPQIMLAQQLVNCSFADRVFYCNSGSEANEAALKFARKFARETSTAEKTKIVAFRGSFHGRTMGALSVTSREKYREPFEPLLPNVQFADFNDCDSAIRAVDDSTCAVIVEPLQGEGGVNPATPEFIACLRTLCDQHEALLIFDEVQCGLGRTGALWAYEWTGIEPDVMTVAKPLAGGLPIGVALVRESVASVIHPGDHGSTFAGGPLVCSAARVVLDRVNQRDFLSQVREHGDYLREALAALKSSLVEDVRGSGLLIGLELSIDVGPVLKAARDRGLLIINAGERVIRLCPPLIITKAEIDEAVSILSDCLKSVEDGI